MHRAVVAGLVAAATIVAAMAGAGRAADQVLIPPAPTQWVTDNVGFLSAQTRDQLNQQLRDYESSSGHQVIVWIGDTTGDVTLEDWTIHAMERWRVGRKGLDDGAILFVFSKDHAVRIEVGYGLEGTLTDARSSEIIRNEMIPKIRAGDNDGALTSGVQSIITAIANPAGAQNEQPSAPSGNDAVIILVLLAALVGPLVFLLIVRRAVMYHIPSSRSSPWIGFFGPFGGGGFGGGGFGGGGFGGFSGGGGMGGGGGASGHW
jgi:uncharacterized protein